MLFEDVKQAVDRFSPEELRRLREYIENREQMLKLQAGTVNIDSLLVALADIRAGLSEDDFAEIERAMNAEYVVPPDPNS